MKKSTFILALLAGTAFTMSAYAQDDFTKGSNYHLLYLDEETFATLPEGSVTKDFRSDDLNNFLYVWNSTYTSPTSAGPNWNGVIGEYLSFEVTSVGWSGLGFASPAGSPKDMSGITSEFTFHIACKTTNAATHMFGFDGGNGIGAKVAIGATPFVDNGVATEAYTDFARDGQWHMVEIPMSVLFEKGLRYPEPFTGNVFFLLSGGVTGTNISMDAIYFYKKVGTGVKNATSDKLDVFVTKKTLSIPNATQPISLYSVTGVKVKTSKEAIMGIENVQPGVYMVHCGGLVQKVLIK